LAFDSRERGLGLGDFGGQRTYFLVEARAVEIEGLELYEVFNEHLHR
jgi:hypothetical protein